jgi:hypothetical protein
LLWHYLCFNLIDRQHPTKLFYSVLHHIYVTQLDNRWKKLRLVSNLTILMILLDGISVCAIVATMCVSTRLFQLHRSGQFCVFFLQKNPSSYLKVLLKNQVLFTLPDHLSSRFSGILVAKALVFCRYFGSECFDPFSIVPLVSSLFLSHCKLYQIKLYRVQITTGGIELITWAFVDIKLTTMRSRPQPNALSEWIQLRHVNMLNGHIGSFHSYFYSSPLIPKTPKIMESDAKCACDLHKVINNYDVYLIRKTWKDT